MKKYLTTITLTLLLIFEAILIILIISPTSPNTRSTRSLAQALVQWHDNPSVENKQLLEKEELKIKKTAIIIGSILSIILILNTSGIIILFKKRRGTSITL